MAYTKMELLDKAVEIAKAYATGGGSISPDSVLQMVYTELKKINEDVN